MRCTAPPQHAARAGPGTRLWWLHASAALSCRCPAHRPLAACTMWLQPIKDPQTPEPCMWLVPAGAQRAQRHLGVPGPRSVPGYPHQCQARGGRKEGEHLYLRAGTSSALLPAWKACVCALPGQRAVLHQEPPRLSHAMWPEAWPKPSAASTRGILRSIDKKCPARQPLRLAYGPDVNFTR